MSNIAVTLNFGNHAEAAEMFEAFAAALRSIGSRVSAAAVAAVQTVAEFTEAPEAGGAAAPVAERKPRAKRTDAAPAPVAVAPAPVAVADVGSLPRPDAISLDVIRAYLARLLKDQRPGRGTPAGLTLLARFAPAGNKAISAVPADSYPALWDSISRAIDTANTDPVEADPLA